MKQVRKPIWAPLYKGFFCKIRYLQLDGHLYVYREISQHIDDQCEFIPPLLKTLYNGR